ncbi:hypothetical protein Dsin_022670 [Dipteronia sinensis]|uniref:F-box domain-containing protein n=1 Tax=Dipteronia sinensis TaxID=43782 RepID=A0AAE0DZZ5_9ROSI|nr:hypothetical protein Dsin_022670 [Dipteronia sinensis]
MMPKYMNMNVADLKIMEDQIVAMDRISDLPDFIIHHIMSYLSTLEATQMCVLSKRWNHLQTSFPILYFDQIYFEEEDLATGREERSFCMSIDKFIQFVDASLLRFCEAKVSMEKFRLSMKVFDVEGVASLLDKWIELAVANEVKELDLNVQTTDNRVHSLPGTMVEELDLNVRTNKDRMYTLPGTLFSAKFVTTLKLSGCNLEMSSAYTTMRFHSLKKLVLNAVHIDEQMVSKFISECPLLEDLFLGLCWHCKRILVSHAPKLKTLTVNGSSSSFCDSDLIVHDIESIEIVARSLEQCTLIDVDRSSAIDMVGCADLKYFNLTGVNILVQEFHKLISKFPLLEKLIVNCCVLESISLSSNRLKELQILHCSRLRVIDIDVPSLLTFSYVFYGNPASSINVPYPCSWKVGFSPGCQRYGDLIWLDSIKKFLKLPYEIDELSTSISIQDMESFNLDKFKKNSPSLPREVRNLTIAVGAVHPSNYAGLLDCLLWICYPRILSMKPYAGQSSIEFIMWLYEKMMKRDAKCCNGHRIKCWHHYLKDFKIESFVPLKDPKPLHMDNLMVALPNFPQGTIRFRLDWCFSEHIDEA